MHINAATLLNLVHLSMVVASIPAGLSVTLGGAPSAAPLVVHGRKLSQVSAVVWCAALRGGRMYDITSDFRRLSAFYLACAVLPTALRVALSVVMSTPLSTSLPQPWQVGVALCWVAGNVADLYVVAHEIRQLEDERYVFANLLPHPTSSRLGKVTRACIFLSGWLMMLYLHAAAEVGPPRFDSQNQKVRPCSKSTLKDLFNGVRLFFLILIFIFFQKVVRALLCATRRPRGKPELPGD